jgi:hypothetical protein
VAAEVEFDGKCPLYKRGAPALGSARSVTPALTERAAPPLEPLQPDRFVENPRKLKRISKLMARNRFRISDGIDRD